MARTITNPDLREALRRLDGRLRERFGHEYVGLILFSSRARGDNEPDSDADVAVVWRGQIEDRWGLKSRIIDETYPILLHTGIYIQPWPVEQRHFDHPEECINIPLLRNVLREGITAWPLANCWRRPSVPSPRANGITTQAMQR